MSQPSPGSATSHAHVRNEVNEAGRDQGSKLTVGYDGEAF